MDLAVRSASDALTRPRPLAAAQLVTDCDHAQLKAAKDKFVQSLRKGEIAFFYFAGHGGARQPEPSVGHTIDAKAPAWMQPRRR